MNDNISVIYGKHAVGEALKMRPDIIHTVYVADTLDDPGLLKLITHTKIVKKSLNPKKIKGMAEDAVHQGIAAEIDATRLVVDYEDFMRTITVSNDTAFAILGELQDPHNVGAVIRSAAAFGISAVLIPEHRQAQVTGTVVKVSVGMAFHVPLVRIGNVNHIVADLKDRGFWIYGLAGEAEQSVTNERFEKPSVFILGNEGEGIRKKTLEHCDIPLRIPMHAQAESLNASASAAVVFYAWSTQHPGILRKQK